MGIEVETTLLKIKAYLDKQTEDLKKGNIDQLETILYTQAVTLNELFNRQLMLLSFADNSDDAQTYSKIALKAQNQCRNTLATLAEIKRPNRTIFVRQQNNVLNQQLNRTKIELFEKNPANELLEKENVERLDIRTEVPPVTINSSMEAMETINRGKDN
jgi:predicted nucleotidyltransferase